MLQVLTVFLIPLGGGIPAGVLLAKSQGLAWPVTTVLYFVSDVILACIFEPLLWLIVAASKRSATLARLKEVWRRSTDRTLSRYGKTLGPVKLILISFGVDPMTGRAAAASVGHGFVSGWMLAIAGDLIYFGVLMVSTLWLNNILGDGTWTTLIILGVMILVPEVIRRLRRPVPLVK